MIGIDICNVSRFSNMNNLDMFLKKYFTKNEIEYVGNGKNKYEHIAGIFSLKEAFVKAIGTGFGNIRPIDVEVVHNLSGKPNILFNGSINKNIRRIDCSISHDGGFAVAVVHIEISNQNIELNFSEYKKIFKERDLNGHKGTFGKVGIIGGSVGMSGSVYLCAKSALRCGSGLVYNVCPKSISEILQLKSIENIILPVEDLGKGRFTLEYLDYLIDYLKLFDSIAIGCGLGKDDCNSIILERIIDNFTGSIVIDADAIFYYKNLVEKFSYRDNIILTPHSYEFSALSGLDIDYINKNREASINKFLNLTNSNNIIVLKGKNTIIKNKNKSYINNTGNDGMATAGSGDCLTGIIISLLGQGIEVYDSAKLGVYLHGLAGDIAVSDIGKDSLIASDIVKYLSEAIKIVRG